jgi:hypothetical protein
MMSTAFGLRAGVVGKEEKATKPNEMAKQNG